MNHLPPEPPRDTEECYPDNRQKNGSAHVWADTGWIIDACTPAVEALCHLVLRTSFPFHDFPGIHQRYVEEFIGALVIGLNEQKQTKQRKRQENLKRIGDLPA